MAKRQNARMTDGATAIVSPEADEPEDIVVEAPETEDTQAIEVAAEHEDAAGPEDWKAQFEAAKKQAEEAEAKRLDAEKRAAELERLRQKEATDAKSQVADARVQALSNALANAELERADAKQKYAAAMQAGDYDAAAEAQAALSEVAIKAQRIKEGKNHIEREIEAAKHAPADPLEQFVQTMSPQSAAWIRAHPDSVARRADLERAHYGAVYNRFAPDSPEYFAFIETELGYRQREERQEQRQESVQRATPPPAAPVSRGGASEASSARANTVRLTAAEVEAARISGLSNAEYAAQKLALEREGKRTTH